MTSDDSVSDVQRQMPLDLQTPTSTPWTLTQMVSHVRLTFHVNCRVQLHRTQDTLSRVAAVMRGDVSVRRQCSFVATRLDLVNHMAIEERDVFPYLRAVDEADRRAMYLPRAVLDGPSPLGFALERAGTEDRVATELRVLEEECRRDDPRHWRKIELALRELRLELQRHIAYENEILFPRALDVERRVRGAGTSR